VISINDGGEAPPSNTSCTAAPLGTLVTATLVDSQTLVLNWTDNSNVEDGYEVWVYVYRGSYYCYPPGYQGPRDQGAIEMELLAVRLPAGATSWQTTPIVDTECDPATEYTFYVVATRDGGMSNRSNGILGSGLPAPDESQAKLAGRNSRTFTTFSVPSRLTAAVSQLAHR
jgi:hypothetical protein